MKAINLSYILVFFGVICPIFLWGQITFEAVCNSTEVVTGTPFEVSFQLRNANIKKLEPPSFNGLQAQGPNVSHFNSFTNGRSSSMQSYNYYVVANKPGSYKIGAAKVITASGQTLYSKPIQVKAVEKSSSTDSELAGKVFLRTVLSNTDAVVGEQITVDIKIFTKIGIEQVELVKAPSFENLFSHYLRSFSDKAKIELINGEHYKTQILHRMVVFPSKPGTVVVEPAIVDIGIASNRGGGLFNPYYLVPYTLKSMPVEINVKELDGTKTGFSGAVGRYLMQTHVEKNTLTSDDVVELTLRIRGEGDIKQVLAPNVGLNKKYFEQFKPNINEDVREGGGLLGGFKEFQYVLTPKALGEFSIKPTFTYFNSELKRFVTIDTTITINIEKGNTALPTKAERDAMKDEVQIFEEEKDVLAFKQPQNEAQFLSSNKSYFLGSFVFWFLALLPFLGLAGLFVWKKQQEELDNIPVAERKRNNAASQATIRLKNAKNCLDANDSKTFFKEISKALLGFVGDKYGIPKVDLTKDNVRQELLKKEISVEKIDSLVSILQSCEMALFAGLTNNESMSKVYKESEDLIQLLDK